MLNRAFRSARNAASVPDPVEPGGFLAIHRLSKAVGDIRVISDVSLAVRQGELLCLLGPSGSGKTTLLRCIAGLERQSSGAIHQCGKDMSDRPPGARDVGFVFQSYALFPNMTVENNIEYGLRSMGLRADERRRRVLELVALMQLGPHLGKVPAQLSGGEQQRVALARALALQPRLLVLDEPLSAVDAKVRSRLRGEIVNIQRKLGITTILVTHDQQEALTIADRIAVMNRGAIEQVGTPQDVFRRPATAFVADFVGNANILPAVGAGGHRIRVGPMELACAPSDGTKSAGTPHILGILPADIAVDARGADPANAVAATVERVEFLGNVLRAHFSVAGTGLSLRVDVWANGESAAGLRAGSHHILAIPPDRIHVFGADAGSLAPPVPSPIRGGG